MEEKKKTKAQLIDELNESRKRIAELEEVIKERKLKKDEHQWVSESCSEMTFMSIIQKII